MEPQYIKPGGLPPQLTRAQLRDLPPDDVVRAHEAGQLEVITTGREPTRQEQAGERWASAEEDRAARETEQSIAKVDAARARQQLIANLKEHQS